MTEQELLERLYDDSNNLFPSAFGDTTSIGKLDGIIYNLQSIQRRSIKKLVEDFINDGK